MEKNVFEIKHMQESKFLKATVHLRKSIFLIVFIAGRNNQYVYIEII